MKIYEFENKYYANEKALKEAFKKSIEKNSYNWKLIADFEDVKLENVKIKVIKDTEEIGWLTANIILEDTCLKNGELIKKGQFNFEIQNSRFSIIEVIK